MHVSIGFVGNRMLHIGPEFGGHGQEFHHELMSESVFDYVEIARWPNLVSNILYVKRSSIAKSSNKLKTLA